MHKTKRVTTRTVYYCLRHRQHGLALHTVSETSRELDEAAEYWRAAGWYISRIRIDEG